MHLLSAQNGVSRLNKQLQIFCFLCTNMAALSLFQDGVSGINNQLIIAVPFLSQDGVSGVHKMTRYKDGGLLGKIFLTV
jgi:hypothetical protein